jgi:prephenate dehydrogenase
MYIERICIVGLGLIGGSFGLALRLAQRTAIPRFPLHITVVETDPKTRKLASRVADIVTADFAAGVQQADLVVLATPVRTIIRLLEILPQARPAGCMVLDLGSSKAEICATMEMLPPQFAAIGGHPMCGREVAGFGAATPDLFLNSTFILCPTNRTSDRLQKIALQLVDHLRAAPLHLQATLHDDMVAVVSHLPYLISATLMQNAADMAEDRLWPISSTGFQDTSRVSGTDPLMMLDILLTNKQAVLQQIAAYQERLTAVSHLIRDKNENALFQWLQSTQEEYFAYQAAKSTPQQ